MGKRNSQAWMIRQALLEDEGFLTLPSEEQQNNLVEKLLGIATAEIDNHINNQKDNITPDCERCKEYRKAFRRTKYSDGQRIPRPSVGQYFVDFKEIQWLCRECIHEMVRFYGHDLREREKFEKQILALIVRT